MSKFANFSPGGFIQESTTTGITANPGGGQSSAVALGSEINLVSTVATAGDSVALPPWASGLTIVVWNQSANPLQVFGSNTDTINGQTSTVGVSQMPNSVAMYVTGPIGTWACEQVGTGFSGSYPTSSFATGFTAHAGGGQASATPLTACINRITTVATQGNSVALPPSAPGMAITIDNRGANPCQVFGAGTDTINGIATATGISHGVNQVATYYCTIAGNWDVQFSLAQQAALIAITASGAIPPHVAHSYVITDASAAALTLAAPTATTDDGLMITVASATAAAHTITATGLLQTGSSAVNVATFAAQKGAGLTLMAYQGKWTVLSQVGITFS